MVKLHARKSISVIPITAIATIEIKEKRQDLCYLLKNLDQLELSKGEKANLALYLEYLALLKNSTLTPKGKRALETEEVFIPESGLYDLQLISQPVLGLDSLIVHFERRMPGKTKDGKYQSSLTSFSTVGEYNNKTYSSWKNEGLEFSVYFENNGNDSPSVSLTESQTATAELRCEEGLSCGTELKIENNELKYRNTSFSMFNFLKNLPNLVDNWDSSVRAKMVTFEEIKGNREVLESFFQRSIAMEKKTLLFSEGDDEDWSVELSEIDIIPRTESDAKKWLCKLMAMQLQKEKCYYTLGHCESIVRKIAKQTPISRVYGELQLSRSEIVSILEGLGETELLTSIRIAEDLSPEGKFLVAQEVFGGI